MQATFSWPRSSRMFLGSSGLTIPSPLLATVHHSNAQQAQRNRNFVSALSVTGIRRGGVERRFLRSAAFVRGFTEKARTSKAEVRASPLVLLLALLAA
jgi:hypothetical protein